MGISEDPEFDIISALADKDVLTMVRGLAKEEARSPFPDGLYGMDSSRTATDGRKERNLSGMVLVMDDGGTDSSWVATDGRKERSLSGIVMDDGGMDFSRVAKDGRKNGFFRTKPGKGETSL